MTATDYATHWATVIGCDLRAGMSEIQRAAQRRSEEAMRDLRGPALSEAILRISEALDQAKAEKSRPRRSRKGTFEA